MLAWLCRLAFACLLTGCLLAAGCAGKQKTPDPALVQAMRELAAGVDVSAVPGTGILSHDSQELRIAPRVHRVASVRHGGLAGVHDLSGLAGARRHATVADTATSSVTSTGTPNTAEAPGVPNTPGSPASLAASSPAHGSALPLPARPGATGSLSIPVAVPPAIPAHVPSPLPMRPVPELWRSLALEAQAIFGLDATLVLAVIQAESSFNATAVSSAGAEGAMQIMPRTQEELGLIDPFDPRANVYAGAQYLMEQLQRFGSVELALAAYNAGPASVERYGGIPPFPETREYVRRVLAYWEAGRREAAQTGSLNTPR